MSLTVQVLHVEEGISFGEESLLAQRSRITVIATRGCELGVASHRNCEFIVQQSPDIMGAVNEMSQGTHAPLVDLLFHRPSKFFELLGDNEIKFVAKHMHLRHMKKDTELFKQGDRSDSMFFVRSLPSHAPIHSRQQPYFFFSTNPLASLLTAKCCHPQLLTSSRFVL